MENLPYSFFPNVCSDVCMSARPNFHMLIALMWCRESWHDDPNAAATTIIIDCVKSSWQNATSKHR